MSWYVAMQNKKKILDSINFCMLNELIHSGTLHLTCLIDWCYTSGCQVPVFPAIFMFEEKYQDDTVTFWFHFIKERQHITWCLARAVCLEFVISDSLYN